MAAPREVSPGRQVTLPEERITLEAGDIEEVEEEPPGPSEWLLVVGGLDGQVVHNSTELLHYEEDAKFMEGLALASPRWGCAAIVLSEAKVLVAGGFDGEQALATTEIIDLEAWTVTKGPTMRFPRMGCSAARVMDDQILLIGGYSQDSCEILDVHKNKFRPGPTLRRARACASAVMLDRNRLMIAGGYDRLGCCKEIEVLDLRKCPTVDEWDPETEPNVEKGRFFPWEDLKAARGGCASMFLPGNGGLLFLGGFEGRTRLSTTELLDLANYDIECTRRAPVVGERVVAAIKDKSTIWQLWKPPREAPVNPMAPDDSSDDDDDSDDELDSEGNPKKKKPKEWILAIGEEATVFQVFEEGVQEQEGHRSAKEGMFRLLNPDGVESEWIEIQKFCYPPTHQMKWQPAGPPLLAPRSGAGADILPRLATEEQRCRNFVVGGCSTAPNEALSSTEVLDLEVSPNFQPGPEMIYRRAYCAAVTVRLEKPLGKPGLEESQYKNKLPKGHRGSTSSRSPGSSRRGSRMSRHPSQSNSRPSSRASRK